MTNKNIYKIPIIRSVLFTSLPAFFVVEIFFALAYYLIVGFANIIYYIFSVFSAENLEINMQIFSLGNIGVFLMTVVVISFLTTLEISTIIAITIYDYYRNDHIPLKKLFRFSYERMRWLLKIKMIPFFLLIFFFPKEHIGPKWIFSLDIPSYIFDELYKTPIFMILIISLIIALWFLIYRWIFIFHYILLTRTTLTKAFLSSSNLVKKIPKRTKIFILLQNLLWNLIFTLPIIAIWLAISRKIWNLDSIAGIDVIMISNFISWIINFLFIGLPSVLFLASITIAFIRHSGYQKSHFEKRLHFISNEKPHTPRWQNIRFAFKKKYPILILAISIFLAPLYLSVIIDTKSRINENIITISHRWISNGNFVENSKNWIIEANNQWANMVEIDVYENADWVIILSHDPNIRRITGINKNIFDLKNDDLEKIFLKNGESIPTLAEILQIAKEQNIKLLIEPKIHWKEKNFLPNLVKLIERYDMIGNIWIQSFNLTNLQNIKKLNPHIKIGLIIFGGFGQFGTTNVDFFSVQESIVTTKIVDDIHKYDKKIFVWTVNSTKNLEKYIRMWVDGFITDNIITIQSESQKIIEKSKKVWNFSFRIFGFEFYADDWIKF